MYLLPRCSRILWTCSLNCRPQYCRLCYPISRETSEKPRPYLRYRTRAKRYAISPTCVLIPRSYGYAYFNRRCRWLNCSRGNVANIFGSEMPAYLRRSSPKTGQGAATQYVCQTSWQSAHSHRWRCRNTIIITVQTICMKSVTGCFQWHAIIEGCIPVTYRVAQKVGTIFVLLNFTKY